MIRLTRVITVQQHAPSKMGFPPDLMSFTILLFSPIAAIAIIMQNLLNSLSGVKTSPETPKFNATVVISEAIIKYTMKKGKDLLKLNPLSLLLADLALCAFIMASTKVIGMIAKVRVSFTVTALSRV